MASIFENKYKLMAVDEWNMEEFPLKYPLATLEYSNST